jgi:hypothetical protein
MRRTASGLRWSAQNLAHPLTNAARAFGSGGLSLGEIAQLLPQLLPCPTELGAWQVQNEAKLL